MEFSCTVQACIVCVDTALLLYFIVASSFIKVLHGIILIQTNDCACIGFEGAMQNFFVEGITFKAAMGLDLDSERILSCMYY